MRTTGIPKSMQQRSLNYLQKVSYVGLHMHMDTHQHVPALAFNGPRLHQDKVGQYMYIHIIYLYQVLAQLINCFGH